MSRVPLIGILLIFLQAACYSQVSVGFIAPDTVCTGETISIVDTTTGGSTYYWSFCTGYPISDPTGQNIGNPFNLLAIPAYIFLVQDAGVCYSFVTSGDNSSLIRYNHGSSFSNDPVSATNLGSFGLLNIYIQGIRIRYDNGEWIGFISNNNSIVRLNFGSSLANTPTAVLLGPYSFMNSAHCIEIVKENGTWIGYLTCSTGDKLIRLNFGSSLLNTPVLTNLGDVGGILNIPAAFSLVYESGNWYAIVVNVGNETHARLNFGSSLLNNPVGTNLGEDCGSILLRGMVLIRDCAETKGFQGNYVPSSSTQDEMYRLTFPNGITGQVTCASIGNPGNLNQPNEISQVVRVGDDLYAYVTNRSDYTLTRLKFTTCSNSIIPSSTNYNPPPFSYSQPGTYTVQLIVDEGLPTQASLCKNIVVVNAPVMNLGPDTTICLGVTLTLDAGPGYTTYLWSTGATTRTITVNTAGTYWARGTTGGCVVSDTINITVNPQPGVAGNIQGPTPVCAGMNRLVYSVPPVEFATGYEWTLPPGFTLVSGSGTNSITVGIAAGATGGEIIVHGINSCGSGPESPPFLVTVNHPASANAGPYAWVCIGQAFTVTQAAAANYSALAWTTNGSGTLTGDTTLTPTYTPGPSETGDVTLTLTAVGTAPCPNDTSHMVLSIVTKAIANAGGDLSSCWNRSVLISGSSASYNTTLLWTTSGSGTFSDPGILHPLYMPSATDLASGHVVLTLHVLPEPPCIPDSDHMVLSFGTGPWASPGPDTSICREMSYTVTGFTTGNSSGFSWETDGKGTLTGTNSLNPMYTPAVNDSGVVNITLNVKGIAPCDDSTVSCRMRLSIFPSIKANAGPSQTIDYDSSALLACKPSGGSGKFSFRWRPAFLLIDDSVQNPLTVNLLKDTIFIVKVTDRLTGCTGIDSMRVKVGQKKTDEDCIVVHNVITPNGDGINDTWIIECIEDFPENNLTLFNRWGDQLRAFTNYNNSTVVWDGTDSGGKKLPDGTYYYILNIKNGKTLSGWVFIRSGTE